MTLEPLAGEVSEPRVRDAEHAPGLQPPPHQPVPRRLRPAHGAVRVEPCPEMWPEGVSRADEASYICASPGPGHGGGGGHACDRTLRYPAPLSPRVPDYGGGGFSPRSGLRSVLAGWPFHHGSVVVHAAPAVFLNRKLHSCRHSSALLIWRVRDSDKERRSAPRGLTVSWLRHT